MRLCQSAVAAAAQAVGVSGLGDGGLAAPALRVVSPSGGGFLQGAGTVLELLQWTRHQEQVAGPGRRCCLYEDRSGQARQAARGRASSSATRR